MCLSERVCGTFFLFFLNLKTFSITFDGGSVKVCRLPRAVIMCSRLSSFPRLAEPRMSYVPSSSVIPLFISYQHLFGRNDDDVYSFDHGLQYLVLTVLVLLIEKLFHLKKGLWLVALPILSIILLGNIMSWLAARFWDHENHDNHDRAELPEARGGQTLTSSNQGL